MKQDINKLPINKDEDNDSFFKIGSTVGSYESYDNISPADENAAKTLVLFAIVFTLVGLTATAYGSYIIKDARHSLEWPGVEGIIIGSRIEKMESYESDGSRQVTYYPRIAYFYNISDKSFTSNRVSFGEYWSSNIKHSEEVVAKYPLDARISVYYDPNNPENSVLEKGLSWGIYFVLLFGLVFLAVGIFFGVVFFYKRKKKKLKKLDDLLIH
ncbi:TPA: DUF3592 domain-containing protein [Candidatus Woesearchaeota archaeon]|nr:DUF3592 domain-containing protein [Candidatus Woesearchaeota archaeon]